MNASLTGRVAQAQKDLVAIGPMAAVRAVYELAKRSGAHGAGLRHFVARARIRTLSALPAFAAPACLPAPVRSRTLDDAQLIVQVGHRVFGTRVPITSADDWNKLPGTELSWPSGDYWWDIDIRTDDRMGDVKWTWEFGRHRDMVILARAAHLESEGPWLSALEDRLRWWFAASPSEVGIHWYSNLEIALRVIAWIQVYALVGAKIDPALTESVARQVSQAERHILFDFPYTASSMRNNHLLGDALGLIAIDRFTGGDGSRRPAKIAEKFFANQLERHMHPDGSMIEDSLSYHRFVMEMLAVKVMLGDESPQVRRALRGAAQHLARLGALEGTLPQWGDWDEGRVLASSGDALDVAGSTALAFLIAGDGHVASWFSSYDEAAWYAPRIGNDIVDFAPRIPDSLLPSGGITHVTQGDWAVWFKSELQPSHQHADLTHVSIQYQGHWVVIDPGTGTYNGPLEIRDAFRTSNAHNGFRVEGAHLLTPHRAFRWLGDPKGSNAPVLELGGIKILFGSHDAFVSEYSTRVARAVVVSESGVSCFDWLERPHAGVITLALAPDSTTSNGSLVLANGLKLRTRGLEKSDVLNGSESPFEGWHSDTYGRWAPAPWLKVYRPTATMSSWAVVADGAESFETTGVQARIGDLALTVAFNAIGAELSVTSGGTEHLLIAGVHSA